VEQRIYHGAVTPEDLGLALTARFNSGNLRAARYGDGDIVVVQIATREDATSGGPTALNVVLKQVEDGIAVQIGKQTNLGTIASLGMTALAALKNPLNLLGRLDDLAQDIENLQMYERVWETVNEVMRSVGASYELSERLRSLMCEYCRTANPVGEPNCIACGAPLGEVQPHTCTNCGFVIKAEESICPNCGQPVMAVRS
jgi:hypothetical protein